MGADNKNESIKEKARDFIHEKVAKDEELQNERPPDQKFVDSIPVNTHEVAEVIDNSMADVKQKFTERLDEGTEREKRHQEEQNLNPVQEKLKNARETIYEKTKPPDVKDREKFQDASFTEKFHMMQEYDKKKKETDQVDDAVILS